MCPAVRDKVTYVSSLYVATGAIASAINVGLTIKAVESKIFLADQVNSTLAVMQADPGKIIQIRPRKLTLLSG